MKTKNYTLILFSVLCSLFSVLCKAQAYEWQWAKHGGGNGILAGEQSGVFHFFRFEYISDIVVDEDNNYYFLGTISAGNTHVDGNPVPNYALSDTPLTGGQDIIITSFTCEGTYRWSRVIGGSSQDFAYHLTLDNNGGIYTNVYVTNNAQEGSNGIPVHFSEDDVMPYYNGNLEDEQEARRRGFLLKYDADNGDLIWRKDYQGDVSNVDLQWFMSIGGGRDRQ